MCRQIIVMFNLSGKLQSLQSQYFFYKMISELNPVGFGISYMVGIEISSGTSEFCTHGYVRHLQNLIFHSFYKNHYFFTQSGGGGRLTMSFSQHRHIAPLLSQLM